jgi:hypothetical protein
MKGQQNFFFIKDYFDLLAKLRFEWRAFQASWRTPEANCYHLFNVVLTLNHLFEWILNDPDLDISFKDACISRFNPYSEGERIPIALEDGTFSLLQNAGTFPPTNSGQRTIRQICNKAKHLKSRPATHYSMIWILLKAFSGGRLRLGKSRQMTFPQYYVETDQEKNLNVQTVCEDLIQQWTDFIRPWRFYQRRGDVGHSKASGVPRWLVSRPAQPLVKGFTFESNGRESRVDLALDRAAYYREGEWPDVVWFVLRGKINALRFCAQYGIVGDLERLGAPRFVARRFEQIEWMLMHGVAASQ